MSSAEAGASQGFDLPIRPGDGSSQGRKSSIEQALQKYRDRVLELNMAALNVAIQDLEQREFRPMDFWPRKPNLSPEELPKRRLEKLEEDYGVRLNPPDPTITSVRDFLAEDRRDNLIRTCRLDGISHGEVDQAARNAWIENTERKIATAERAQVRPDGLPAELKYLMSLVRGICGQGLPSYRFYGELRQFRFLSDLQADGEDAEAEDEREEQTDSGWVSVPRTQEEVESGELGDILDEWDNCAVAMGVCIGSNGFAVYCQERDSGDSSAAGQWRWKYGLKDSGDAFETALYETVEEFLDFYAEFNKQSEEEGNVLT